MEKQPTQISILIRIIRPWLLVAALLAYFLGLGIARYLSVKMDWTTAGFGFIIVVLLLEMRAFLEAYYLHPSAPENTYRNRVKMDDPYPDTLALIQRPSLLMISVILLGAGALLTTLLVMRGAFNPAALLVLGLGFLISFFSSVPPVALNRHGYGEFVEALLIANLTPAFALSIQMGELHILWFMLTFSLTLFYLALRLVLLLRDYGKDVMTDTQSMLVRMGWQRGMALHNYLILGGYLLFGLFALYRLPWSLTWPAILSLPLGALQIFQVVQIAAGAKPNWKLLVLNAAGTFAISIYSITLTLWVG